MNPASIAQRHILQDKPLSYIQGWSTVYIVKPRGSLLTKYISLGHGFMPEVSQAVVLCKVEGEESSDFFFSPSIFSFSTGGIDAKKS